jgi:hypothetical protein
MLSVSCDVSREGNSETEVPVVKASQELRRARAMILDPAPEVSIGGVQDDPEDEFNHRNGFLSAVALSDGGIAVIDDARLRIYHRDGTPRAVIGRSGRGPGEVGAYSAICATRGDTLVAYDYQLRRVSVVAPDGSAFKQFSVNDTGTMAPDACFADGTFLLRKLDEAPGGALGGMVSRVRTDGVVAGEIGSFPHMTQMVRITAAVAIDRVWIADPRSATLRRFDGTGRTDLMLMLRDAPVRMTSEEAASRLPVAAVRGGRAPGIERIPDADMVAPLFERVMVESPDRLWLQLPVGDFREPSRWVALDVTGEVRGHIEFPGFSGGAMPPLPVQFVPGGVWLLHRDADGAATFRFHRIKSSGSD